MGLRVGTNLELIPLCDSAGHTGIPFPTPRYSSETNRVSNRHSNLVTTPSSRMILGKPKIEVTKVLPHNSGKNGEHFYWENWHNTTKNGENSDCNSILVTKNLMHHAGRNRKPSSVPFNLNNTSCGFILKKEDWGRNLKLNYTSGGLNISEVDWGDHDPSTNNMNKMLLSEVDWGALHYSSFFLFLVNIDYDAKPKDFFTQELWGGLSERTSSTTLRSLNHIEGKLVHHLELQKDPYRLDHQWDQQRDPKSSPKDFFTQEGRTIRKDNFHHSQKLEPCRREIGTSSRTSEGSKPSGSPVGPTEGPHIFTMSTT